MEVGGLIGANVWVGVWVLVLRVILILVLEPVLIKVLAMRKALTLVLHPVVPLRLLLVLHLVVTICLIYPLHAPLIIPTETSAAAVIRALPVALLGALKRIFALARPNFALHFHLIFSTFSRILAVLSTICSRSNGRIGVTPRIWLQAKLRWGVDPLRMWLSVKISRSIRDIAIRDADLVNSFFILGVLISVVRGWVVAREARI